MADSIPAGEFPFPVLVEDKNLQAKYISLLGRLFCVNKAKLGTPVMLWDHEHVLMHHCSPVDDIHFREAYLRF